MHRATHDDEWFDENGWIPHDERMKDGRGRRWRVTFRRNVELVAGGLRNWVVVDARRGGNTWVRQALQPPADPEVMTREIKRWLTENEPNRWLS